MKKKILIILLGLMLSVAAAFGIEKLLPYTYQVDLNQVEGLVAEGDETYTIFRIASSGGMDEFYDGEFSEEMDEFYDEDFSEEMDEYYEESYEEPLLQMTFLIQGKPSHVRLKSTGNEGGQILAMTPEGETEMWLETTGSSEMIIPVTTRDAQITVQFTDPTQIIEEIQVELAEGFNARRLMVLAVALCVLFLLFMLRDLIAEHIEYGFLIVGLGVVLLFTVLSPSSIWWDEQIHYSNAVRGSYLAEELFSGKDLRLILSEKGLNVINYTVSAVSLFLSRLLHIPDSAGVVMDRLFNGLVYLAICFCAIRVSLRYKRSLTLIALLPLSLFLSVSYSYDMSINAFAFLGIALIINEFITPHEKLKIKNAALIAVSVVIASLPKAVYIPMILLMLFLPSSKFASRKQHIAYKAGVVLVCLMVLMAFAVPMIYEPTVYIDSRGAGDNTTGQLDVILGNVGGYIILMFRNIWNDMWSNLMDARNSLAYVGGGSMTLNLLTGLFMFFVFFTDNDAGEKLPHPKPLHKSMMVVAIMGVMAMTYTVFYITFSQIGGSVIQGVQGRYFLPLFPLLAAVVQPRGVENRMNKKTYHLVILAFSLVISVTLILTRLLALKVA